MARAIIEHSREVWVAADHSKFNRPAMVELARFDAVDMLFTDAPAARAVPAFAERGGRELRDVWLAGARVRSVALHVSEGFCGGQGKNSLHASGALQSDPMRAQRGASR